MNKQFEDSFGSTYHASVVSEPECAKLSLCYPGAVKGGWVEGVGVEFVPQEKEPWYGTFSRGQLSRNAINFAGSCPDRSRALVIARGEGYLVDVDQPDDWEEIPLRPLMGVEHSTEKGIIILWDFVRMMCIDRHGVRWKTLSISWDGIKDVVVCGKVVRASVWDAPNSCFCIATIELETGLVTGGKCPPTPDSPPSTPGG
jgi:hypothetical protein